MARYLSRHAAICARAASHCMMLALAVCLTVSEAVSAEPQETLAEASRPPELRAVLAVAPVPADGQALYATCAACHQSSGWGVRDGTVPQIAGQDYRYLLKQLVDFRSGERLEPRMHHFAGARELDDAQAMANLAAYISGLEPTTRPATGDGTHLALGARIYGDLCSACHGEEGSGRAALGIPVVAGQHYPYLLRQIRWITEGTRHNVSEFLRLTLGDLSEEDAVGLADYMSRLPPARGD